MQCPQHGVRQVRLPWAEPRARFTTLFERLAIEVLQETGIRGAAQILRLSWDEAWHILERAVARGQRAKPARVVAQVGIDEKAIAKGHQYLTLVCDLARATVEYIAEDRKQASLDGYFAGLSAPQLTGITAIAMDMWEPYVQAIWTHVPDAGSKIVFDRYHIMTHMGKAVDTVRKREHRTLRASGDETLTGSKYLWLYAEENLPVTQRPRLNGLLARPLKTARAWAIKESLRDLWSYTHRGWAHRHWRRWYFWATHSRLSPVIEAARLIQRHLPNVLTYSLTPSPTPLARGSTPRFKRSRNGLWIPEPGPLQDGHLLPLWRSRSVPSYPRNSRMNRKTRGYGVLAVTPWTFLPIFLPTRLGFAADCPPRRDYKPCSRITRASAEPSRRVRLGMNFA